MSLEKRQYYRETAGIREDGTSETADDGVGGES